jgi:quercetin dioxygenase-like cupin family protein
MYFYNAKDRVPKEIVPGGTIRTFWGENTLLALVDIEPGVEVPLHTHPHEQSGMVLEGELEMGIEGETRTLGPGDIYIIPGGVQHYAKTVSSKARVLDIFSPVREDYKY